MKHFTLLFCCCLFPVLVANAEAQLLERDIEFGLSATLSLGGVPEELGMNDDEQFALSDVWMMAQIRLQEAIDNYNSEFSQNLPDEVKQNLKSELEGAINKIRDMELERLTAVLSDQQIERLKQVRFQYLRRRTSGMKSLKDLLDLSTAQIRQIEKIGEEMKKKTGEIQSEAREINVAPADVQELVRQVRINAEKELTAVLTAGQLSKLKKLQGKTFEFQFGQPLPKNSDENI